jgi:hypothetical protein
VGGDTGEWDLSGRCSPSLFGSPPRSAWKTSSANFASTEFPEVRLIEILRTSPFGHSRKLDAISGELCKHILAVGILYAKTHRRGDFRNTRTPVWMDGFISATPMRTAKTLLSVCRAAAAGKAGV